MLQKEDIIEDTIKTNPDSLTEEDFKKNARVLVVDGVTIYLTRSFATSGRTILEGVVSTLLDKMDKQEVTN